jgi:hypothetical protein
MFPTISPTFPQFTGLNRNPSSSPIQALTNPSVPAFNPGRLRQDTVSFGASVQQDYAPGSHAGAGGEDPWRPPHFNPFGPPEDAPVIPPESELEDDEAITKQAQEAGKAARAALKRTNPKATTEERKKAYDSAYAKVKKGTKIRQDNVDRYNRSDKKRATGRRFARSEQGQERYINYSRKTNKRAVDLLDRLDPASLPTDTLPAIKAAPTLQAHLQKINAPSVPQQGLAYAIREHRRKKSSQASDSQTTSTSGSISRPFSNLQLTPLSPIPRNQEEADDMMAYGRQLMAMANNWESLQQASGRITPPNEWSQAVYPFLHDGLPYNARDFRYPDGTRAAFDEDSGLTRNFGDSQRKPNETHKKE